MNISVWAPDIKSQVHLPRCVQTITSNTRPEAMQLYLLSISAKKNKNFLLLIPLLPITFHLGPQKNLSG